MRRFLASLLLLFFIVPMKSQAQSIEISASTFFCDFNDESLENWKIFDNDGDGNNWLVSEDGYIYSESSDVIKPKNIIATTEKYAILATSKITFDVNLDKSADKYGIGIAYSLDGENFITLQDETEIIAASEWNSVEFSLNYIAGKEVYIGIIHTTNEDQGTICVDNVRLLDGPYHSVGEVIAKAEDDINISWEMPFNGDVNGLSSYKLYRVNDRDNKAVVIAEDITTTSFQDTEWKDQVWGTYRWGVAALYVQDLRGSEESTIFEEGFETTEYPNIPEGWTNSSAPTSTSISGPWKVTESITTVIAPKTGDKFAFSYGNSDNADFYFITPAIDLSRAIDPVLCFNYAAPGLFDNPGNPLHVKYSEAPTGPWTELWYDQSNVVWKDATVDLGLCSGKTIYIAFVHEDAKGVANFGIGIDNVSVKAQIAETAVPVASRITWSNPVEKDMFTNVYFNINTDNDGSTYGAIVSLQDIDNPEYKYESTDADGDGAVEINVHRGIYEYTVSLDGYYPLEGTIEVIETASTSLVLESLPELIEGLYVSPTAWAMWEFDGTAKYDVKLNNVVVAENISEKYYQHDESSLVKGETYTTTILPKGTTEKVMMEYTWEYVGCNEFANAVNFKAKKDNDKAQLSWTMPTYEKVLEPAYTFSVTFDNGTLEGWTTIDADKDNRNWLNTSEFADQGFGYNNTYCAASISYDTEYGPFNPDNFLVSDRKYSITESSKLTYTVSAQSKEYPNEHYGIAISTKSSNDPDDFEIIFDETLTAGEVEEGSIQGQWFERTIDLAQYAGKDIYIAFRHYNSRDNSWLKLDNISLTSSTRGTSAEKGDWLYYDNGAYNGAYGYKSSETMTPTQTYWAIMFPEDLISEYAGRNISKVAIFDYSAHKGAFSIHEGGDIAPGNMLCVQSYETSGKKTFVEMELENPIKISGKENVWIQFSSEFGSSSFPAAYSADMGDPNSRWVSENGVSWYDSEWFGEGWYGTWMIRAFVDEKDESIIEEPEVSLIEPLGTIIYRDGVLITPEPIKESNYTDVFDGNVDEHEYSLRIVYGGEKDESYYAMSCPITKTFLTKEPLLCAAPQKLHGETTLNANGTFGATLVWPYTKEWIHYDDGDILEDQCVGTGGSMHWGIMFPAEDIEQYIGANITEISLFDIESCDATLVVSYGNDFEPQMTIHQQNFSFSGTKDFFNLKATAPIPIIDEGNLWITITNINGRYPAAVTKNTGDHNGRWCSMDGKTWTDLYSMNSQLDFTWYLRAYISNEPNSRNGDVILDHYNIYRSETNSNYELVSTTTSNKYFDEIERGTYYYQVTAVYKRGDETCESEPASSYNNPDENYVVVEVTEIDENGVKGMMVYPNPTNGNLNISAENMKRITICNAFGQVVYDNDVTLDNETIDMTQYKAGLYIVRITTENGMAVKRISVVR